MPCHKIVYKSAPPGTPSPSPYTLLSFDFDDTLVPGIVKKSSFNVPIEVIMERIERFLDTHPQTVLCIFSNQYSLGKNKITLESVTARFDSFMADLRESPVYSKLLAVYVMFAPEKDSYRKPFTGMYTELISDLSTQPNTGIFIGDAAGRKGDFSCTDFHFANNCGMDFMTPEEFFRGATKGARCDKHRPPNVSGNLTAGNYQSVLTELTVGMRVPHQRGMAIFLVGPPGVGKSTFAKKLEDTGLAKSFSLDAYKTFVKMRSAILQVGKGNIIIDNTNPCIASRARFLSLFKTTHTCVAVVFDIPSDMANHTRMMRVAEGGRYVPDIAVRIFRTKYVLPEPSEGFQSVYTIHSVPDIYNAGSFNYEYLL